ncbi:BRCT domain-containing protein [Pyrenophora tritici-repentis]|nr:BRCT domain-containing protein [Pyrenophora tritici-repentis]KAI0606622.1 BRCT domain-containing protein [Pyrenophora tritici-repentis]KAI0618788.1 BRCT domain-containing protein [Pyrenophora tritici-repentis]
MDCSKPNPKEAPRDARVTGSRSPTPPPSEVPPSSTCEPKFANPRQTAPSAAAPPRRTFFDPWNSSGTGHQRAENRLSGSTEWRTSRNLKLVEQFRAGIDGGKRVADTVGAGSDDSAKHGRNVNGTWAKDAKSLRTGGQQSLAEAWASNNKASWNLPQDSHVETTEMQHEQPLSNDDHTDEQVSDHKLKQLLAAHGARHSIALGRRTVTHVILGTVTGNGGADGGLAATKMQKEIARSGGKAVKFINAEWVLDSIKAGRRLTESRYSPLRLTPKGQNSIAGMMRGGVPSNKEQG